MCQVWRPVGKGDVDFLNDCLAKILNGSFIFLSNPYGPSSMTIQVPREASKTMDPFEKPFKPGVRKEKFETQAFANYFWVILTYNPIIIKSRHDCIMILYFTFFTQSFQPQSWFLNPFANGTTLDWKAILVQSEVFSLLHKPTFLKFFPIILNSPIWRKQVFDIVCHFFRWIVEVWNWFQVIWFDDW